MLLQLFLRLPGEGTAFQRTGRSSRGGKTGFGLGNWGHCWGLNLGFQSCSPLCAALKEVVLACSRPETALGARFEGFQVGLQQPLHGWRGETSFSSSPHRCNGQSLPNLDYLWLSFSPES